VLYRSPGYCINSKSLTGNALVSAPMAPPMCIWSISVCVCVCVSNVLLWSGRQCFMPATSSAVVAAAAAAVWSTNAARTRRNGRGRHQRRRGLSQFSPWRDLHVTLTWPTLTLRLRNTSSVTVQRFWRTSVAELQSLGLYSDRSLDDQKALTRGRTDHFRTKNSANCYFITVSNLCLRLATAWSAIYIS